MPNGGSSIPHLVLEGKSQLHLCVGALKSKRRVFLIFALNLGAESSGSCVLVVFPSLWVPLSVSSSCTMLWWVQAAACLPYKKSILNYWGVKQLHWDKGLQHLLVLVLQVSS